MAEFTEKDLRKARESKGLPRWKLGEKIGVSESTIERWESGETVPTPEDIDNIGEALGEPTLWHKWMLSHYDSYRGPAGERDAKPLHHGRCGPAAGGRGAGRDGRAHRRSGLERPVRREDQGADRQPERHVSEDRKQLN